MKTFLLLLALALVSGCGTLPDQYADSSTRCLIQGVSAHGSSIHIKSVDGGDVIWIRRNHIGRKVWLGPGKHKLSLVCSTEVAAGVYRVDAEVEIDARLGCSYYLTAERFNGGGVPHVSVVEKRDDKAP